MILSVSRRTDIPAFYLDWFFNRLQEGFVLVRNPMNYNQVSRVELNPSVIDCIVFWTKDPTKILTKLDLLSEYNYYFQITINPYDPKIESFLPAKDKIIKAFKNLSSRVGRKKTIWRYDPIILTDEIDIDFHSKNFSLLVSELGGYTNKCIISFIDFYKKTERNMKQLKGKPIDYQKMLEIGRRLSWIAHEHNIKIETCSEFIDLSSVGIEHAKCIDDRLISQIIGQEIRIKKDKNQRDICGCVASVDIGVYNTCRHGCLYCYANFSNTAVRNNLVKHNLNSSILIGSVNKADKITERKMVSYIVQQQKLSFESDFSS